MDYHTLAVTTATAKEAFAKAPPSDGSSSDVFLLAINHGGPTGFAGPGAQSGCPLCLRKRASSPRLAYFEKPNPGGSLVRQYGGAFA
jgi:hypothetical protein